MGRDPYRGAFVKPADEMEQELSAGLSERQVAEFVEDGKVHAGECVGEAPSTAIADLGLELIDEVHDIEEAPLEAVADTGARDTDHQMCLTGPGATDEHGIALLLEERAGGHLMHQRRIDRRLLEAKVTQLLGDG